MNSTTHSVLLATLLPSSPYLLTYTLPLLSISLIVTFAGCFLTLDRTRSFAPLQNATPGSFDHRPKKRRFGYVLEGGIGGLAIGYLFGVHCTTFLAMLIPSISNSAQLSPKSFLVVWLLSSTTVTITAGRFKYVTIALAGITGGASLALALSVMVHPALLVRAIAAAILIPAVTIPALIPSPRTRTPFLRVACVCTGAFGIILAASLLARIEAWAEVWSRFWIANSEVWGSSKEKGLSAAWVFLALMGTATDWFLKRRFGENPDQKWDHYLADYMANPPNDPKRPGDYVPLPSWWDRLTHLKPEADTTPHPSTDFVYPSDADLKRPPLPLSPPPSYGPAAAILRKPTRTRSQARFGKKARAAVKFRPLGDISSDEDCDVLEQPPPLSLTRGSPSTVSSATLPDFGFDTDGEAAKIKGALRREPAPVYSDTEEDVTAFAKNQGRGVTGWTPKFLARAQSVSGKNTETVEGELPPGAVPVTPSLINALDRLAKAQETAFKDSGGLTRPGLPPSFSSDAPLNAGMSKRPRERVGSVPVGEEAKGRRWEAFWHDVTAKAAS